jgi:hypothetical protein
MTEARSFDSIAFYTSQGILKVFAGRDFRSLAGALPTISAWISWINSGGRAGVISDNGEYTEGGVATYGGQVADSVTLASPPTISGATLGVTADGAKRYIFPNFVNYGISSGQGTVVGVFAFQHNAITMTGAVNEQGDWLRGGVSGYNGTNTAGTALCAPLGIHQLVLAQTNRYYLNEMRSHVEHSGESSVQSLFDDIVSAFDANYPGFLDMQAKLLFKVAYTINGPKVVRQGPQFMASNVIVPETYGLRTKATYRSSDFHYVTNPNSFIYGYVTASPPTHIYVNRKRLQAIAAGGNWGTGGLASSYNVPLSSFYSIGASYDMDAGAINPNNTYVISDDILGRCSTLPTAIDGVDINRIVGPVYPTNPRTGDVTFAQFVDMVLPTTDNTPVATNGTYNSQPATNEQMSNALATIVVNDSSAYMRYRSEWTHALDVTFMAEMVRCMANGVTPDFTFLQGWLGIVDPQREAEGW